MKRFLTFLGSTCYPIGGMDDLIGAFDSAEDAEAACLAYVESPPPDVRLHMPWWHVFDLEKGQIVARDQRTTDMLAERAADEEFEREFEAYPKAKEQ